MAETSLDVTVTDEVSFRFAVTNGDDAPLELTFRDAGQADFAVLTREGEEVWRWSEGRMFAQALQTARLEPGETATFEGTWPDPEPGEYTAVATLRVREREISARADFSV